jgi:IclR family transcriptional regulator, pca regulon regulatory protein
MAGSNESPTAEAPRRREVSSLLRGLTLLEALASAPGGTTPQRLTEETGLDRSTLQRLLRTLVTAGYAERVERGRYGIAPAALSLAVRLMDAPHLRRVATPHLTALHAEVGEIVNFAVLSGVEIVYIARIAPHSILSMPLEIGSRQPASATSLGRAILSRMPEAEARMVLEQSELRAYTPKTLVEVEAIVETLRTAQRRGYALVDQELELGLRAIAAPVLGAGGRVVGSIDVSVPSVRMSAADLQRNLAPHLLETAAAFSAELGYQG